MEFNIANRKIGSTHPTYIIAELSCNHNGDFQTALKLLQTAASTGVDAVKLQTYTADTITIDSRKEYFKIQGTIWEGEYLYDLYSQSYTPWEWIPELQKEATKLGIALFSSPFDITAVDYLESVNVPAYKVASFEITDHILLKRIAQTGKPVIVSTGMASLSDISEAMEVLKKNKSGPVALLKCTSAYPAKPENTNLLTIPNLAETFGVVAGLSDHTLDLEVPLVSVALGARIIEKHFTLSRSSGSPDDSFSLEPEEFKQLVSSVRIAEKTLGKITYGGTKSENDCKKLRRSLFSTCDIPVGTILSSENIRSVRPGHGLHTKYYEQILGKKARVYIEKGTPLDWNLIE